MIFGCCFTRFKYLEGWEEMELQIHARQYTECFFLALLPALALSVWLSWWWMLLAFMSYHLPHTYTQNCVVYTGTHDNTTTRDWYHTVSKECRDFAKEYLCKSALDEDQLAWDFIAMAMGSVADLCIIPLQDYLCLGAEARINTPSTLGGNWVWRMKKGQLDEALVRKIHKVTKLYGRLTEK